MRTIHLWRCGVPFLGLLALLVSWIGGEQRVYAQTSELYMLYMPSPQPDYGDTYVYQGGNMVRQWHHVGLGEGGVAVVGNTVRQVSYNYSGGTEYTLSGVPTGQTYPTVWHVYDGTSDGQYIYAWDWYEASLKRYSLNWEFQQTLFSLPGASRDYMGVTYDYQTNTVWLAPWGYVSPAVHGRLYNYSLTGQLLGTLPLINAEAYGNGLAYDPADNTLWFFSWTDGRYEQYTKSGTYLGSVSGMSRIYGAEFAVPEPARKVIEGVPDYRWNYGCAPTSGGMVVGYWSKRPGYAGLAPGTMPDFDNGDSGSDEMRQVDANGGHRTRSDFNVVDNVIASYEHVYDYWVGLNQFADNLHFPRHDPNCVADCMWSNQVVNLCRDGGTAPWEESTGLRNYARRTGYSFDSGWTAWPFCSFELVKTQVDLGHPVLIDGFLANQPGAGHTIVAYGYRDGPGDDDWIAVRDTWQNALGNGYGIVAEIDAEGREWWKWANPGFGVIGVTTFAPHVENAVEKFLADTFDRFAGLSEALGYIVDVGAGNGTAEIVSSPTDPTDSVLRLLNPDPDLVAIERSVPTSQAMDIEFEYLFGAEAKLLVKLDTTTIGTLLCPSSGPGSVGSGTFGHFDVTVVLSDFGLDPNAPHQLRLELTSAGDPLVYLDDLLVSNPNAVPEPAAISLVSLVGMLLVVRRKRS